jgi:hypothetical protein
MKFTSPYVNKASNWLIFVKGPIRGFVYIRACEFQYELLNFTTKFGTKFATFAEKLYEINCKKVVSSINYMYKIKLKQSNFERNAKKILGFEHFSLQIRDIEKNCLL